MSGDMSEDEAGPLSAGDWFTNGPPSPNGSIRSDVELEYQLDDNGDTPSQPTQKRRRVTRACDECRRKKIKCDGKQPCTHCSVYSYECTYDKPSNRRRNPAPQYIEALEGRLQRAEALLRRFMPDVDLTDPNLDPSVQQEFRKREQVRASKVQTNQRTDPSTNDAQLMSMIDSIGQLDLDDSGGWDFHGNSSGTVFLKRMKEHFRGLLGPAAKIPFLQRIERPAGLMSLDSPSPAIGSPLSTVSSRPDLPPKDVVKKLCYYSLSCATCLLRIIHLPSFYEKLDIVYDKPAEYRTVEETRFVGLVYAVLALGCMYDNLDAASEKTGYKTATEEGLKYYKAARSMLQDITECHDLTSLQALLFIILFLQATSNLSACYAFVGIALRSAMRMGLHRNLQHEQMSAIEGETRSRVFYVIRQMDIYVSTLLGFPLLLNLEDIDQRFPTEVNDEFITPSGIIPPPPGMPSLIQAFNAQTQLMEILVKIMKHVYPMKAIGHTAGKGNAASTGYTISYGRIKEIESDLRQWYERLPQTWRPSSEGDTEIVRVRHLLRFAYAHVQLVLYRPFIHYVSPRLRQSSKVDELSYACAAAAISVSRNIVHIGLEIRKHGVLSGPYWFMLYTEFFAVLSLVFYAIENPGQPGSAEVLADARAGRQMIADLADKSQAADRVSAALQGLFDQLPDDLEQPRQKPATTKKRSAPAGKGGASGIQNGAKNHTAAQWTDDLTHGRGAPTPGVSYGAPTTSGSSVDNLQSTTADSNMFQDPSFSTMHNSFPLDVPSRATPESTSTTGGSYPQAFAQQGYGSQHSINKLDSLMFPSEDPFAYPNQPMMELGGYHAKSDMGPGSVVSQGSDSQFFVPGSLEEFDTQLLGQPPPYVMQEPQQHGHPGMGLSPNMYDPNSFMHMPPEPPKQHSMHQQHSQQQHAQQHPQQPQRPPPPPPPQSRPQQQQQSHAQSQRAPPQQQRQPGAHPFAQHRRAQQQRMQERQIDQMFTEQGMQADFGSFFGSGRGGFQGM